jgi:outer membrane autotransporter protein
MWAAYIEGGYAGGNRDTQVVAGGGSRGFDYQLPNGKAGLEYLVNPDLRVGAAVGYAKASVNFNNSTGLAGGHLDVSTPQIAGYASYTRQNWFTDAVVTYGHNSFNISRPGVIDTLTGKTDGDSYSAAFKSAYLFDAGMLRIGPIGGLQFVHSHVSSYAENGDSVLTQLVQGQSVSTLIGSAGVQARLPFVANNVAYSPFLNVTAEHDFIGNGRTIIAAQTDALVLPIFTIVPNAERTYGKVAGGIAAELSNSFSLSLTGSSTFARNGGNDYSVNGGLRKTF